MDKITKEAIISSMKKKRELDLDSALEDIVNIPECNADKDKLEYSEDFFYQVHHIRLEYYKKMDEPVKLTGMTEPYQNNIQNLLELINIQNDINKEYRDKFDVEVFNIFITKKCV
ncbi:hypothetical protein [uncultured Kriegella sp.]|uniref:hypothetical protein n=1 Tax=uncultured Kriegella sp. TaxID=1798910 RepID=UPI0030DCC82F